MPPNFSAKAKKFGISMKKGLHWASVVVLFSNVILDHNELKLKVSKATSWHCLSVQGFLNLTGNVLLKL